MPRLSRHILFAATLALTALLLGGCGAYFNTFYNAKKAFNEAESERKKTKPGEQERIQISKYNEAAEKALKVVEDHPNSKYYDDAVYVLGVSYYYAKDFARAERRFREILTNYPDSKFARDSRLYLAKSMLAQDDEDEAMGIFENLFTGDLDRQFKTEAALALGEYHFNAGNYEQSNRYFLAVRDSLGNDQQKRTAQLFIADGLLNEFLWDDALTAYLQVLGMNPTADQKYHALYNAATAAYRLQQIKTGQDYLTTLADDELYFDSLSVLRLRIAEGYDWENDLDRAVEMYEKVAEEGRRNNLKAEANLNLGLIHQFEFDELAKAKEYYDKAVNDARSSEYGQQALQLSSDIGKLETFSQNIEIDSTTSQDKIDEAAYTQYQLAELYWFQLRKPDTAMLEMQYIVDSFPTAYDAPKAMIALAQMAWEQDADSSRGDSILQAVLEQYPHSDFIPQALELLDLKGTAADTGYAEYYLNKAEDFYLQENIDSAKHYYRKIVDDFPDSKYYLQARFADIWLDEQYRSPGDSSIYYAYQAFADSFQGSEWANLARNRLQYTPGRPAGMQNNLLPGEERADTVPQPPTQELTSDDPDAGTYASQLEEMYQSPDGQTAIDLPDYVDILETREPFEYPTEAYTSKWEGEVWFQIRLDFSGQVTDVVQKSRAPIEEINIRAQEAVLSTTFDMKLIQPEWLDRWFMYKFKVFLPDHLR
jgi:TolA-binding protein